MPACFGKGFDRFLSRDYRQFFGHTKVKLSLLRSFPNSSAAIGSLWTVSDKSTAMLMICFYQLWRAEGRSPAQALAEAQRELRERDKFKHPFYWAAFYMTGI